MPTSATGQDLFEGLREIVRPVFSQDIDQIGGLRAILGGLQAVRPLLASIGNDELVNSKPFRTRNLAELIRFTAQENRLNDVAAPWGSGRVIFLQYASDAVVFYDPRSLWRRPAWMTPPVGPDVSPDFVWLPVITFLQLTFDVMLAVKLPKGHGHPIRFDWIAPGFLDALGLRLVLPFELDGLQHPVRACFRVSHRPLPLASPCISDHLGFLVSNLGKRAPTNPGALLSAKRAPLPTGYPTIRLEVSVMIRGRVSTNVVVVFCISSATP